MIRLRPGVHVAPVEQGLSVAGRGRSFVVPGGPELAANWNELFPQLHSGLTAVDHPLFRVLAEADLLLFDPGRDDHGFPRTLNYLQTWADEPDRALNAVRRGTVAVLGGDTGAFAAARALLNFGVGTVIVDDAETRGRLTPLAAGLGARLSRGGGADLTITVNDPTADTDVGVLLAGEVGVISPASGFGLSPLLDRMAVRTGERLQPLATSPVLSALAGNVAALQVLARFADLPGQQEACVATADMAVRRFAVQTPTIGPLTELRPPAGPPRPTGTLAPPVYTFQAPADDWLLAVTHPLTGLVPARTRPEVADAVRSLLPTAPDRLWPLGAEPAGAEPVDAEPAAGTVLAVSGYSLAELAEDALGQLNLDRADDPVGRLRSIAVGGRLSAARWSIDPLLDQQLLAGWISFDRQTDASTATAQGQPR